MPPTKLKGVLAEWIRRLIRNQLGYARVSSNLTDVGFFNIFLKPHASILKSLDFPLPGIEPGSGG